MRWTLAVSTLCALLAAGCMGGSTGSSWWGSGDDRWGFEYSDGTDAVTITYLGTGSHSWSEWSIGGAKSALRVGLNGEPGKSGGVAIARQTSTPLGGLGGGPPKVGDSLEICVADDGTTFQFTLGAAGGSGGVSFRSLKPC